MMIKYRVHDVAKDLSVPNKDVIDTLEKYEGQTKKYMAALTEDELNLVFESFTQKNNSENLNEYFAQAAKQQPVVVAEQPDVAIAPEKPAQKQAEKPAVKPAAKPAPQAAAAAAPAAVKAPPRPAGQDRRQPQPERNRGRQPQAGSPAGRRDGHPAVRRDGRPAVQRQGKSSSPSNPCTNARSSRRCAWSRPAPSPAPPAGSWIRTPRPWSLTATTRNTTASPPKK